MHHRFPFVAEPICGAAAFDALSPPRSLQSADGQRVTSKESGFAAMESDDASSHSRKTQHQIGRKP
jgi:hypothetical protein